MVAPLRSLHEAGVRRTVRGSLPAIVAVSISAASAIFVFTAAAGLTGSLPAAVAIAVAAAGPIGFSVWRRSVAWLDESAAPRALKILSGAAAILAIFQLTRLAVFTVAPSRADCSFAPWSAWEISHSCVSAYFVAAQAADEVPNVYDESLYSLPGGDPTAKRNPRMIDRFGVDVFEYPPPFLLLPRAIALLTPDFLRFRMLWFGLTCGALLIAMLVVARWLGPVAGTRALLLLPLVWAALPTLSSLQKGNFQTMTIAGPIVAMVLFERRRFAAGGALLAFATVSKLFPGVLLVYLVARRQWRAAAWTAALAGGFVVLSIVDMGWAPIRAFLDHLPRLVGGEAFPAFRNPAAIAINMSVPGIVFKLKLFGVPDMSFTAAKLVGWIYTLALLATTVVVALRSSRGRGEQLLVWMAILIFATLRSPFLPLGYGVFPAVWLLTLLGAIYAPTVRTLGWVLLAWIALVLTWPIDWPMDPRVLASLGFLPMAVTILVAARALRRLPAAVAPRL